ncbi:RPC17 DNA-directed RNA polymerase III subunit RPC9 [Candida maltosa Xu316]|uniref:DNA-directed RNA polymerase III subunit RPC9 n=1 Tax=Candida maltosa (strain Xu316) TaxID=1245528 RepID=M3JY42_CANMX|nr:DNA-directed RNA polymerase III subunit, putative [Candida maltosa Xu316]
MKVLTERDGFLSDFEVEKHLKNIKTKYNWTFPEIDKEEPVNNHKHKRNNKHYTACGLGLETITKDVLIHFSTSDSRYIDSEQGFKTLMEFLNSFELMKIEKLQIVNSLPRSLVVLYAIVEECEERFGEATSQSIIDKIDELFPLPEAEEEEGEEEEVVEGDEEYAEEQDAEMEE